MFLLGSRNDAGRYVLIVLACGFAVLAAFATVSAMWRGLCLENTPPDWAAVCDAESSGRRQLLVVVPPLAVLAGAVAMRRVKPLILFSATLFGAAVVALTYLAVLAS
jgi:hypothetical protein